MSEFNYSEYLASREWAQRKEAVRERSRGYCERCGVGPHQATHHKTYANIGKEPLEDLLGVCNRCHEFLSAKSDYDPSDDLVFIVVAANRTHGDTAWVSELPGKYARVLGKVEPLDLKSVKPLTINPWGDGWLPPKYRGDGQ